MYQENTDSWYITPGKRVQMVYWTKRPFVNMAFSRTAPFSPFATHGFGPEMVYRCKGKPLFRKTCSRYRLLDGKRCVAARKTVQCTKTCSRYRYFCRKGCIAARENLCFAKPARDTDFWTGKGVSRHGETAQSAKTRSRLVNGDELELGDS